jgi:hypothetical protein
MRAMHTFSKRFGGKSPSCAQKCRFGTIASRGLRPSGIFDVSCPAIAQGPTRLARGLAFAKYMNDNFGAHHETVIVPFCGHSARCLFTSDVALPVIFPK